MALDTLRDAVIFTLFLTLMPVVLWMAWEFFSFIWKNLREILKRRNKNEEVYFRSVCDARERMPAQRNRGSGRW